MRKVLIGLCFVFSLLLACPCFAGWLAPSDLTVAAVEQVNSTTRIKVSWSNGSKEYWVTISTDLEDVQKNRILSVALTALSTGTNVCIQNTGHVLSGIRLLSK